MTVPLFLLVAVAGGLGAMCRLMLDSIITSRLSTGSPLPAGTIIINVTGSFALGLVLGLGAGHVLDAGQVAVLGAGFLGGYTTLSAASHETVRLLRDGRSAAGLLNALGVLVLTTAVAALGLVLGSSI